MTLDSPFSITERYLGYESDNLINYYAGPIFFSLNFNTQSICISTTYEWVDIFEYAVTAMICNLDLTYADVIYSDDKTSAFIKYDLVILEKYLAFSIVFN